MIDSIDMGNKSFTCEIESLFEALVFHIYAEVSGLRFDMHVWIRYFRKMRTDWWLGEHVVRVTTQSIYKRFILEHVVNVFIIMSMILAVTDLSVICYNLYFNNLVMCTEISSTVIHSNLVLIQTYTWNSILNYVQIYLNIVIIFGIMV